MFSVSLLLASVLVFPFPRFSPMPHLGAEPAEQHQHTKPGPNLPLSLSLPVYVFLCLGMQLRPASITLPHHHIYCTCLLAPCHPHTAPRHLVKEPGRRKEKKINANLKSIENDYSCWGQACLTSTGNTHDYPERCTYTVALIQPAGGPVQSRQRVSLKATTLWWAIKAYLHSVPMKGSEAPKRSCVWSDISVPLHSLLYCHDLGYIIKKSKNMGKNPVPPPRSCLLYMWTATATSVWSVDVANSGCL